MNLRDKIGQRIMVSFAGPELTPEVANFIIKMRAGGVIHFGSNVTNPAQIARLNRDLQDLASRNGLPPLIIAVDEEGGRVSRMPAGAQQMIAPSQMAQAAAGPDAPALAAGVIARNLRRLGFNLDFAPVADINNNPANPVIATRSYGSDPEKVATAVTEAIKAYLANGIAPCVKHFPGHGDTSVDSHLGLPVVNHLRDRLDAVEIKPFIPAFAAGVPALMTAHILYPKIEPEGLPATLSPYFLKKVLRQELGFTGVVFTDALNMQAIADRYSAPEACYLTFQAGADIAIPLGSLETQLNCLEDLLARGETREMDMEESLKRILALKERFCQPAQTATPWDEAGDSALLAELARRSITVLGTPGLPLRDSDEAPLVVDFELPMASQVEEGRRPGPLLETLLRQRWPNLKFVSLPATTVTLETGQAVLAAARSASRVVVVTRNATRLAGQAALVKELLNLQPGALLVAARDPYDLLLDGQQGIALYGDPPVSIMALVEALFGGFQPTGQLPVPLE